MSSDARSSRGWQPGTLTFAAAAGLAAVGTGAAALGWWEQGVLLIAASLLASAAVRMLLPESAAGWLRMRKKRTDVLTMALLGIGLVVVFLSLPPRPY